MEKADLHRAELIEKLPGFDGVWVRLRNTIDKEVLRSGEDLRWIASPTTGLNHIDLETAKEKQISVVSLRGEYEFLSSIRATAEHTIALILGLLRHLPAASAHCRSGQWDRDQFVGRELHEKVVGVLGYGRLGKIVASYLRAFDCEVLVWDPAAKAEDLTPGITLVSEMELLGRADIVTVHVNLVDETTGYFGKTHFDNIKPGAVLVNTSRGELMDENELLLALERGKISGAALDVLCNENSVSMSASPLVQYAQSNQNLVITPHIGGCTRESMAKTEVFIAEKLSRAIRESNSAA